MRRNGSKLKIGLLGTRGVPANYGGFETCVEQLGQRLVERGHNVTVYCRWPHIRYTGTSYKGMNLVKLPTISNKYLDTLTHCLLSTIHALPQRYDVAAYFIAGNSPLSWIPRLVGTRTVLNVDGLDWKRDKWPAAAKRYIQFAEWLATWAPAAFITDSRAVQGYYAGKFRKEPVYIPYGSEVEVLPPGRYMEKYGLTSRGYVLFVGRVVPENNVHQLVEAFNGLRTDVKCVVVGGAAYADEYIKHVKEIAGRNVIFTGYLFGEGYRELSSHAYAFVETSGVGGTHPALIEAMAFGNCVVVNGTAENLETIGNAGLSYRGDVGSSDLRRVLEGILSAPEKANALRGKARERARNKYSWEQVTDEYERVFYQLTRIPYPARLEKVVAPVVGGTMSRASLPAVGHHSRGS